ncbi:hypothetical protein STEG23_018369, partial [Scotinomys teguina]
MHSPGPGLAVQGRGAQAAALADALASLRRTRARMASLTAYVPRQPQGCMVCKRESTRPCLLSAHRPADKDVSSASYNLSSATTGSYYSCVSQITIGYDVTGPVAIGLTHWKNPYVQGRPTLPSDLPLFLSKDAGIPVYHQSFTRKADLATPLSCPASLSITPVPSYSSSSQETLSQDTTEEEPGKAHVMASSGQCGSADLQYLISVESTWSRESETTEQKPTGLVALSFQGTVLVLYPT